MTFPWPYLDVAGFAQRSAIPATDVALVAAKRPGYIEAQIAAVRSKDIDGRLRKRYGNSLPFGGTAPSLSPVGTAPPPVTLTGTPTLGSMRLLVAITTAGALGAAQFTWSADGGTVTGATVTAGGTLYLAPVVTFGAPTAPGGRTAQGTAVMAAGVVKSITVTDPGTGYVTVPTVTITDPGGTGTGATATATSSASTPTATAASVVLGTTGLTALFPVGAYSADNFFQAPTPCPEAVLRWITQIVTPDVYRARGVNPQDPQIAQLEEDRKTALAELLEAANGETGLFDLPFTDATGSAVTTGGPYGYSETSPYVAFDREADVATNEDCNGGGTSN